MTYNVIRKLAYIYILLPLLAFSTMWLNAVSTIVYTSSIGSIIYLLTKENINDDKWILSKKFLKYILLTSFIWVFLSGVGGYWYQSADFCYRNAIFRDLINYSWPVYYSQNGYALNYYFGFWLIPALFTKLFTPLFDAHELFFFGTQILMLWTILGIFIFFCLLIYVVEPLKTYQLVLCLVFPIIFSGIDIVGALAFGQYDTHHLEWWTDVQYSCLTTQLFWVFNQAIISWIATLLLIMEKNRLENLGVIFIASLFCAPYPTIGLSVFMLVYVVSDIFALLKNRKIKFNEVLKKLFSYQNMCAALWLPILYFFFSTNESVIEYTFSFSDISIKKYIQFCLIEFGVYFLLIFTFLRKDVMFYVVGISLSVLCLLKFGSDIDFQMRASIPAILLLMVYVLKYINFSKTRFTKAILIICLIAGSVTPIYEIRRGYYWSLKTATIFHETESFYSFSDVEITKTPFFHFLAKDTENKIFYQYFSKKPSE